MSRQPYITHSLTRVSVAVVPKDLFTPDSRPAGKFRARLKETGTELVRNSGGLYIGRDLPPGDYTAELSSPYYLPESLPFRIEADADMLVLRLDLLPGPAYPFPEDLALLRGTVRTAEGLPIREAGISADVYQPAAPVKARLSQPAAPGDTRLQLMDIQGSLAEGDVLLLKEADASLQEYVRIAGPLPENPAGVGCNLSGPLKFRHAESIPMHLAEPAVKLRTRAGEKGDWALPVTGLKLKKPFVTVTIEAAGRQKVCRDAQAAEGTTVSLCVITLLSL